MSSHKLGTKPKNIRSRNTKLIIDLYRNNDNLSVSEISRLIKLSRTTVTKINEELLERNVIVEAGKRDSTVEGGKRPSIFKFNAKRNLILSFHIKYNSIQFRVSDLKYERVVNEEIPIKADLSFDSIGRKMQEMISKHEKISGKMTYLVCLVAIHGNVDPDSGICIHATYFPSWGTYTNLKEILEKELEINCPIHLDTWLRYKAYGENIIGLAKGFDTVVLIDAGWHGVAAGILLEGQIYQGKHYLAGEIGHIQVNRDDTELCACGGRGCFEQQLGVERLTEKIQSLKTRFPESGLVRMQEAVDIPGILQASESGDPLAREIIDEIIYWFAYTISQIIMFFDPELILIEGDYACQSTYFEEGIQSLVKEITLPRLNIKKTEIRFNSSESVPTLKGAAAFGVDRYYNSL
jgi:predicted NBD/HSP70 family sugar kinase